MGVYEVTVDGEFHARHSVALPGGKMEDPHLHRWRVRATFRAGRLDEKGFVLDFLMVRSALRAVTDELEGRDLNDRPWAGPTGASAERLAEHVAAELGRRAPTGLYCVRVTEAPGCSAAFYPSGSA